MSTVEDSAHEITAFDSKLVVFGKWSKDENRLLEYWAKSSLETKRERAAEVIGHLIPLVLDADCTSVGKRSARNIKTNLVHLEDIIETTKKGFSRKFYRDHLNHLVRVMLLGKAIINNVDEFQKSSEMQNGFILASLFHDISYPLSQITEIYGGLIEAMKNCYNSCDYPNIIVSMNMVTLCTLMENLPLIEGITLEDLGHHFSRYNHGLLSAMEFLQYVKNKKINKYLDVIKAIVFHDSGFKGKINVKENKLLFLLILCDDMQDWGRPSIIEEAPTITEIADFKLDADSIEGTFNWNKTTPLSPLRQIQSKFTNFLRFNKTKKAT